MQGDFDKAVYSKENRFQRWLIAGPILIALYGLTVSYNLNYFYLRGAGDDPGWFAWLASNALRWPMPNPGLIGGNFLEIHMSPIFFVSSALLAPLSYLPVAVRFSLFISLWVPLLWLAVFLLLHRFVCESYWARCAIALLLTFNGIVLSMLGFPHIETLISALGLLAIATLLRADTAMGLVGAGLIAMLALAIREDAGLHLFLVLLALSGVSTWAGDRHATRRLVWLAAMSLAGSIVALWVQKTLVAGGGERLGSVYLGNPILAHVSAGSLIRRLSYWATRREYIFLPFLLLLVAAGRRWTGDRRLLIGAALATPWLVLSLGAIAPQAGDLWSYYAFPLLFMFFWPLLLAQPGALPSRRLLSVQITMGGASTAAFVLVGILPNVGDGGSHDRSPWLHLLPPAPATIRLTEAALADRDGWLFDYGTAALAFGSLRPGQFRPGLAFDDSDIQAGKGFLRFTSQPHYLDPQIAALQRAFPLCAPVTGTALELCTRPPQQNGG